jgi:predicted RNase H-like HicB family nuclease
MEREEHIDSDLLDAYQRRHIVIYPAEGNDGYIASCPSLPGCDAAAETWEETIEGIKESIELWIITALAQGQPIPADIPIRVERI